ncbi:hypothetical protein [Nonomuraea longicatena]|uniref:Exporter of polyketide antibiotics n=1 Tax=Nonomuraea longicatena TaxID=83682 RepID=A0ABP3ZRJ4_9ACTN
MTVTVSHRRSAVAAEGGALTGTGILLRLALRRDRIKLPAWTLGVSVMAAYFALVVPKLRPEADILEAGRALMELPLMQVFSGPLFGLDNADKSTFLMLAFVVEFQLLAAVVNILLVARHTRAEEQTGRAELVRAAVVGRHASLTAAFLVAVVTDVVMALLLTLTGVAVGLPAGSAALFGVGTAVFGLVFAGVTAVTVQLTRHSKAACGIASGVLFLVWTLRAVGAVQDVRGGWATWLTPMGWSLLTRVLDEERWWPLALSVLLTAVLLASAYRLSARRDLGAGLMPVRPGPARATARLRSPFALALRLQRASFYGWGIGLAVVGLLFGGLAGAMRVTGTAAGTGSGPDMVDGFLSLTVNFLSWLVSILMVMSVVRARNDEVRGLVTPLLATPTSRPAWLGSTLLVAALAAVGLLALSGLAAGVSAASALGDGGLVWEVAGMTLARAPESLVVLAVAAALFGLAPRILVGAWVVIGYGGVARFWGTNLPDWLLALSPFNHIPRMPVEDFRLMPLVTLSAAAVLLVLAALYGFRRRDLDSA